VPAALVDLAFFPLRVHFSHNEPLQQYSRIDVGDTAGSCRVNRLLFADDFVLLASSQEGLQHALDRFSAACDRPRMKISTKKTEVLCLSRKTRQCMLQASGNILQQVVYFQYVGVVFTSDGRRNKEVCTRIGKANAVLCELYRSVGKNERYQTLQNL